MKKYIFLLVILVFAVTCLAEEKNLNGTIKIEEMELPEAAQKVQKAFQEEGLGDYFILLSPKAASSKKKASATFINLKMHLNIAFLCKIFDLLYIRDGHLFYIYASSEAELIERSIRDNSTKRSRND